MAVPLKLVYLTVLTVVALAGPILMFIGVALTIVPSSRQDRIDEYNSVVNDYDGSQTAAIAPSGSWINTIPTSVEDEPVVALRDTHNVDSAVSTVVRANVNFNTNYTFYLTGLTGSPLIRRMVGTNNFPIYKTTAAIAYCTQVEGCTYAEMDAYCKATYDPAAQFSTATDCNYGACYECAYPTFLKEVCVVVERKADGTYVEDTTKASCYYPFTVAASQYGNTRAIAGGTGYIDATVRLSTDPFIAMQRLTEGSMEFGPNVYSDVRAGYGLLVTGAFFSVVLIFVVVYWVKAFSGAAAMSANGPETEPGKKVEEMKTVEPISA